MRTLNRSMPMPLRVGPGFVQMKSASLSGSAEMAAADTIRVSSFGSTNATVRKVPVSSMNCASARDRVDGSPG